LLRIGLIGDTQGNYPVAGLLEDVGRLLEGVDEIWHAGDWQDAEILEGLARVAPLTVVDGNAPHDARYPERVTRSLAGLTVGMIHRPPPQRDAWAATLDICIHGHTHRWRDEVVGRTRFINVSSPTIPAYGDKRSAGILSIDGSRADLRRLELKSY
jgi:putative phosphoesterase